MELSIEAIDIEAYVILYKNILYKKFYKDIKYYRSYCLY